MYKRQGLDGLASSVTLLVAVFFSVVAIGTKSGIEPITCAVIGALMGFLLFNVYPASVFMGDTGSLALGGFVSATAYMLQMPLFILIVGLIYLVEVVSVMIPVSYTHLIETTGQLVEIIRQSIPMKVQKTTGHPAKRTFQAIRIELNRELDVLKDTLDDMIDLLNPGGRLCVITFHSLEDRIVKSNFRRNENPCTCPSDFPVCVCGKVSKGRVVTRKPILPGEEELEVNSRSKSAKLRIFERA